MDIKDNLRRIRFFFVCNLYERQLIKELAKRLNRSQSDAVRQAVQMAVLELRKNESRENHDQIVDENDEGERL